ncbi:MAG: hypothetical protein LBB55_02340 [Zoogloeaceae bacterium]|nr:hypothetical protein [Zoogloeaceae bacterium]
MPAASFFLALLLAAAGIAFAFHGQGEAARQEEAAQRAATRLAELERQRAAILAEDPAKNSRTKNEALRKRLEPFRVTGFFSPPGVDSNIAGGWEKQMRAAMMKEKETADFSWHTAREENSLLSGSMTIAWKARHAVDFLARLRHLHAQWRALEPSPPPLGIEHCALERAGEALAARCRLRWQMAAWPGASLPAAPRAKNTAAVPSLPSLGRLFFTQAERQTLDLRARASETATADTPWQGLIRFEKSGKTIVIREGTYADLPANPGDIGGTTEELLRGGKVWKEQGSGVRDQESEEANHAHTGH